MEKKLYQNEKYVSGIKGKTAVTPLLMHWSY